MIIVKSIKEKPKECRDCRLLCEVTYDCAINPESIEYTTLEGQYEHCPIEEAPDINVGSMDITTHEPIPAETGKNYSDRTSGDCISRHGAIDYCYQLINVEYQQGSDEMNYGQERVNQTETILHHLEFMPSVQPEREKGEWVYNSPVTMKCNRCGLVIKDWDWHRFKICPNCGADMRGEQDDT